MLRWHLLFNGKVGKVGAVTIYSVILVKNSFMVSPGTHVVKNIESQSRNNESQIKKIYKFETALAFV